MKTIEALNVVAALNMIANSRGLVPSKFAYASAINRKRLAEVAEAFEAGRKVLLDKYGEKDAEGKLVEKDGRVTLLDPQAFQAEMIELSEQVADVRLHAVPLDAFPAEIGMAEMEWLMPMVLDPEHVPAAQG